MTTMTKEQFLELAEKRFESIIALKELDSFFDYEKEFDQIWTSYGREVLENSLEEEDTKSVKKTIVKQNSVK